MVILLFVFLSHNVPAVALSRFPELLANNYFPHKYSIFLVPVTDRVFCDVTSNLADFGTQFWRNSTPKLCANIHNGKPGFEAMHCIPG